MSHEFIRRLAQELLPYVWIVGLVGVVLLLTGGLGIVRYRVRG